MKKIKKLLALIMAMAMILGMSVTAFAAPTNPKNKTITVSGTGIENKTEVKYGQIIVEDRTSTLGWKFISDTIGNAFVEGWKTKDSVNDTQDKVIEALIASGMIENPANYNAENNVINASEAFGAALGAVKDAAQIPMKWDTNRFSITVSGKGLYVITANKEGYSFIPMAAYMDSVGTDVYVTAKGSENQIRKTISTDGTSVAPGDTVKYTVEHEYPYYPANADHKTFWISDTLTKATFVKNTVKVYIDKETNEGPITSGYTFTWSPEDEEEPTGLKVNFEYNSAYAGKTVTLEYDAVIDSDVTSADVVKNNASSSNGTAKVVKVKPVSFTVIKEDEKDHTKLAGAEFTVYKKADAPADGKETTTLKKLLYNDEEVWGEIVETVETAGDEGKATFNKLDAQETYYVKETKAPNGYSLNDTVYKVDFPTDVEENARHTVKTEKDEVTDVVTETHTWIDFADQTVTDTKLSSLPSTGGIGTTIFTIGGCVIMIIAAGLFFASRRKSAK